MNYKAVLFDADGVVVRAKKFSDHYALAHNIAVDDMTPFFTGEFQKCIIGKADLKKALVPWLSRWQWGGSVDEFLQYWFETEVTVDERVVSTIKQLRSQGIVCGLATNQVNDRIEYFRKELGFDTLFDYTFVSSSIGHKKPSTAFYSYIFDTLRREHEIAPSEILYFDDSEKNVLEAQRLGVQAYHYQSFSDLKTHLD